MPLVSVSNFQVAMITWKEVKEGKFDKPVTLTPQFVLLLRMILWTMTREIWIVYKFYSKKRDADIEVVWFKRIVLFKSVIVQKGYCYSLLTQINWDIHQKKTQINWDPKWIPTPYTYQKKSIRIKMKLKVKSKLATKGWFGWGEIKERRKKKQKREEKYTWSGDLIGKGCEEICKKCYRFHA